MEEKNKPGETVPEPGESERISAERKAALQDIDRKREEKEKREAAKREKESRRAAARSATAKPEPETDDAAKAE